MKKPIRQNLLSMAVVLIGIAPMCSLNLVRAQTFTTVDVPGSYSTELLSINLEYSSGYFTDAFGTHGLSYDGGQFYQYDAGAATILTYTSSAMLVGGISGGGWLGLPQSGDRRVHRFRG